MPSQHTSLPALACALWLTVGVVVAHAAPPMPLKIAEERLIDIQLDQTAIGHPVDIRTDDASFIKVHVDQFALPDGVTLEIASPDGRQLYRYNNSTLDSHTVDKTLGQNGRTRFSAMSIHGAVAVVRLVGQAKGAWQRDHGVRIRRYLEGYSEKRITELGLFSDDVNTFSICGSNDKKAAACYASSDPQAFDRSRPVARLVMSGGGLCTAWRVGASNRMFTNNHCFATASEVAASEVWFNYQLGSCGGSAATPTKVAGDQLLATNTTLDYTLFTVKNFASISSFGYLGLDPRAPVLNEEIFIAGHPGGRQKEMSVVSDQDGGGRCRVNAASTNGNGTNTDAGYYCDTEGGSSGSPVIARSSMKVIALHHLGGCFNTGAKVSLIWPQVSTHFGGVVPDGDTGTPPTGTTYSNNTVFNINDNSTIESPITVSGRTGNGSATTAVAVNITHTYIGDLKVDLIAPDGSVYVLHNRSGGSADNIVKTFTTNLSSEPLNGTWKLRVNDNAAQDIGKLNSWSITF